MESKLLASKHQISLSPLRETERLGNFASFKTPSFQPHLCRCNFTHKKHFCIFWRYIESYFASFEVQISTFVKFISDEVLIVVKFGKWVNYHRYIGLKVHN